MSDAQSNPIIIRGLEPGSNKVLSTFRCESGPDRIDFRKGADFDQDPAQGPEAAFGRFKSTLPGSLHLAFMMDRSSLPDPVGTQFDDDITRDVLLLRKTTVDVDAKRRQPPVVRVTWGQYAWIGRVRDLQVDYKIFRPDGRPLRARVRISMMAEEVAAT